MLRIIIFFIAAIATSINGARRPHILGGDDTKIGQFPHMVSIHVPGIIGKQIHYCGGAIISPRHILTAAHCFYYSKTIKFPEEFIKNYTVLSGTNSLLEGGNVHRVKKVIIHEDFRNGIGERWLNDVAVLVLDSEITYSEYEKPIDLPDADVVDNTQAAVSGWSITTDYFTDDSLTQTILQTINVTIVSHKDCLPRLLEKGMDLRENHVCGFFKKGSGLCTFDSGSPMVQNGKVIGIASWVTRCAAGYPDIYTNVYRYLDFITNAMQ